MRYVCIVLTTILLLILNLVIVLGDEAFATIEFPNMTLTEPTSVFTPVQNVSTPASLGQLAMNAPPSNISQQLQLHLDEAIKALQAGDTAGAKVHMTEADKVIQEGAAKMHLDEAIKALESGDTAGAETHAQMAPDSL